MRQTSEILYKRIWYLPTYLKDKTTTEVTLLGHTYEIRKTRMGNIQLHNRINVWPFDTEEAMVDFISKKRAVELPSEADGKPQYVPQRVLNLKKKYQATEEGSPND